MKRRKFIKNMSLASVAAPFVFNSMKVQAVTKKLFNYSKFAGDRVLVIIRLNGGNDGLSTVIPRDQYANLTLQRSNVLIPEASVLPLTSEVGLHPVMTGMQNMFNNGKLSIIQNVGYPEQNRSHFRSMDIWSTGMMDVNETRGWLGRQMDVEYPNFPDDYPNATYKDPFAISMGDEVSATCQGLMANFSHVVSDPFASVNLLGSTLTNDGTYFGSHMEYLATLIDQTNKFGSQINAAANAGSSMSTLYDPANKLAMQLKNVAKMISGGLKSKVYILNVNGFDTHDSQVTNSGSTTTGVHADLLKTLSDAIYAFQDDLTLLGISHRVAGMTFSEFGRQIASNASLGTDHGDAAPLFLFGSCISSGILGANPVIGSNVVNQQGIPMQIDFRDVYASILKDWFEVPTNEIQQLFEHTVTYYNVLGACNLGLDEEENQRGVALLYPNPAAEKTTLRFETANEWVKIEVYDMEGRIVASVCDTNFNQGTHHLPIELSHLSQGLFRVTIQKASGMQTVQLSKVR